MHLPQDFMRLDYLKLLKNVLSDQCQIKCVIHDASKQPIHSVSFDFVVMIDEIRFYKVFALKSNHWKWKSLKKTHPDVLLTFSLHNHGYIDDPRLNYEFSQQLNYKFTFPKNL